MEEKLFKYALDHPVLISLIIPCVLGVLASFISEGLQRLLFTEGLINQKTDEKRARANFIFRMLTFGVAMMLAVLSLLILASGGVITSFGLGAMFILINVFVPFAFYHLKGKAVVELIIGKMFTKVKKL